MKRFHQGQLVHLADPVHIAARFYRPELGGIMGAGGVIIPRQALDGPAYVFRVAEKCKCERALIVFGSPESNQGMWLNVQDCIKGA